MSKLTIDKVFISDDDYRLLGQNHNHQFNNEICILNVIGPENYYVSDSIFLVFYSKYY